MTWKLAQEIAWLLAALMWAVASVAMMFRMRRDRRDLERLIRRGDRIIELLKEDNGKRQQGDSRGQPGGRP